MISNVRVFEVRIEFFDTFKGARSKETKPNQSLRVKVPKGLGGVSHYFPLTFLGVKCAKSARKVGVNTAETPRKVR